MVRTDSIREASRHQTLKVLKTFRVSYPQGIPVGTRVCDRILIMIQFFKVRSAYRIPILILNNERTSYVSRSSFVSQYRIAKLVSSRHCCFDATRRRS
jgi:hypothetical protein